jgi:intracellular sulfur oxidation DsrE/DsrF family protein
MIDALHKRGMISLVCAIAAGNVARSLAEKSGRNADEVRDEVRANLVPGAILVPSGIYALIRAQNAGCAYMQGT